MRSSRAGWRRGLLVAAVSLLGAGAPLAAHAQDADGDGVPDASDNCPDWSNPGQEDVGGLYGPPPDGIGDACQCGDLNGDGHVDLLDAAIYQRELAGLVTVSPDPGLCSVVGGRLDCEPNDRQALREALVGIAPGVGQVCQNWTGAPPLPPNIAAVGDSITRAFAADCDCNVGFCFLQCLLNGDQPEHSWFDGNSAAVTSIHDRYDPGVTGVVSAQVAVSGAEMLGMGSAPNFAEQADAILALPQLADLELVVVELGGNDICNRDCVDGCGDPLYTDAQWTTAVEAGLDRLVGYVGGSSLPADATIYLLGVPRIQDLYPAGIAKQTGDPDISCEGAWAPQALNPDGICRIATDGDPWNGEDLNERREGIAQRIRRYNEILRDLALAYTTDPVKNPLGIEVVADYATEETASVGTTGFGEDEINGGDCFHPSLVGQNLLSDRAWDGNPRQPLPP